MCGIIGFSGRGHVRDIVRNGLSALEYRGYDSCGYALYAAGRLRVGKEVGAGGIVRLAAALPAGLTEALVISHTRWATHGANTAVNAHPHLDCGRKIAVVHNGIIENHGELRAFLELRGHTFRSDTDTEVIPHLIEEYLRDNPFPEAVRRALRRCDGTFALAAMTTGGGCLVAARRGLPLIVAGENGNLFIASDYPAIPAQARKQIGLEDGEMAVFDDGAVTVRRVDTGKKISRRLKEMPAGIRGAEKGGFQHFMRKEIYEQPAAVARAISRYDRKQADELCRHLLRHPGRRMIIAACGTSWHAGLIAKYLTEAAAGFPVEVDYASEFRYRQPVLNEGDVLVAVSQSGETADTLAAVALAKEKKCRIAAICNVPGSSIARESDYCFDTCAGPEIGVASTKAFTTQVTALHLLALSLARAAGRLGKKEYEEKCGDLRLVPSLMERILKDDGRIEEVAVRYAGRANALYLGRGVQFPIALEGALKLKEVSYIHAEGYPAAEMKHGPIALIDRTMPVIFIAVRDRHYQKVLANIEEVRARGGDIILVTDGRDVPDGRKVSEIIEVPPADGMLLPLLTVVPLQMLAYHIAVRKGCNVDKPRNLAKSVTVE